MAFVRRFNYLAQCLALRFKRCGVRTNIPDFQSAHQREMYPMPVASFGIFRRALFILLPALFASACTTVPETGRSQLLLISASEESQLGLSEFDKVKKNTPLSKDAAQTSQPAGKCRPAHCGGSAPARCALGICFVRQA